MKKFKKLIPAFCMLLVSAVMLGTSTFAWFSMNTQVKATGLNVNAKTDTTYLLITDDASKTGESLDSLNAEVAAKKVDGLISSVLPVTYIADATTGSIGGKQLTTAEGYSSSTWGDCHWFTANSEDADKSNDNVTNIRPVSDFTTNTSYRIKYNVWLTLSKDSASVNDKKVQVSATLQSGDASVKAFVKIGGDSADLVVGNGESGKTAANVALSASSVVEVTIYVYIDGESEHVNSKYLNTSGITGNLSLTFDLVD